MEHEKRILCTRQRRGSRSHVCRQRKATPSRSPSRHPKVATGQPAKNAEQITDTKRFAEHTGLYRASSVVGSGVKDLANKDAGKIEDLLLDHRGHVGYAVVSFGGFMGIGDKLFAVPWDAVIVDREKRTVYHRREEGDPRAVAELHGGQVPRSQ